MGPIYQLSVEEEKILIKYLEQMIKEKKIRPSSSTVGSPILFVPKPNGRGLRLCIDYRHLNDYKKSIKHRYQLCLNYKHWWQEQRLSLKSI